jgi:hypothetical protein
MNTTIATIDTPEVAAFSAFFLTDSARLELLQPDGEALLYNGQPVAVHLYGPCTDQFVAAQHKKEREATKRVVASMTQRGKKAVDSVDTDADAQFLCAVTARFENFPFPGGAEAIYRDPRLKYINNQVSNHLADLGNFFKTSAPT